MLQLWCVWLRFPCLDPLHVTLCGERVFADVMQLRVLRGGDRAVLSGRSLNVITGVLRLEAPEVWHRREVL